MGEIIHEAKSDKWLIYKLHKELIQFNSKTKTNPIKKIVILNRHFSKEDIRWPAST